jgi:CMP-N-acetylneuraminic acid synthetase
MRETDDRIGNRPFLHEIPESVAMDIDWEEQFTLLNDIALSKLSRNIPLI